MFTRRISVSVGPVRRGRLVSLDRTSCVVVFGSSLPSMGDAVTSATSVRVDRRCGIVADVEAACFPTLAELVVDVCLETGPLGCELAAGHDGAHVALAATGYGGDQWWWLRWNEQLHEVIQIDPCAAELTEEPSGDCCILPDGHIGRHSFDLAPLPPVLGWPPARR